MKTQLHELKPSYYLVSFYRISNRMLVYVDYLHVEYFPFSEANFDQLTQICRFAARFMTVSLGFSVYFKIEYKVNSDVAHSDDGHLFECPNSILRKYNIFPIRE